MSDVSIVNLAASQFNRFSRAQAAGMLSDKELEHRVSKGRLILVEQGVFAIAPVLDDPWGRWMGATLTAQDTFLSRLSAACAWGALEYEGDLVTVSRPGSGGPVRFGGLWVHRSSTLEGECTELRGVPITTIERTLLDLACGSSDKALARALRDAVRLEHTTLHRLGDWLGRVRHRRGAVRLARAIARYSGLPLERARSGAEVRALEILRDAAVPLPRLNVRIAGEEADLSWPRERLIVEIDGGPFHMDVGEDARKEAAWRGAGWKVRRIPSDDIYERPRNLLALALATQTSLITPYRG